MENLLQNFTVVLSAGGEGSRFQSTPGASGVQKSAFVLPTGDSMIERTIKMYRDAGVTKFVILAYHHADSIQKLLGDGSQLGVSITYSYDPEMPVGRGGAMKHALNCAVVSRESYLVVHNPDDQILGDAVSIVTDAIQAHMHHSEQGAVATAIMVSGTNYEFSGFEIVDGKVVGAQMYPFVPIPTHIGMTIFSPEVVDYFERLFSVTEKTDFEAVLFPVLTEEGKLSAHFIPNDSWISVNDHKDLKKLLKALEG